MAEEADLRESARVELAEAFGEVARSLLAAGSVAETLRRISAAAVEMIPGCDHAGISLVRGRSITTEGASDDVPQRVDAIQYDTGQGPCLQAMREDEVVHVDDLWVDGRWPEFSKRVVEETGVRSVLAFRLFDDHETLGALNLFSRDVAAFDEEADHIGAVLAAHAAVAIVRAKEAHDHDVAMRSRDVIGQAKGILMARQDVSEDEAFDLLRRASQRLNIKLRDVADALAKGRSLGDRDEPAG